jgi:hypothetical protein
MIAARRLKCKIKGAAVVRGRCSAQLRARQPLMEKSGHSSVRLTRPAGNTGCNRPESGGNKKVFENLSASSKVEIVTEL